jgi:BssS protein family
MNSNDTSVFPITGHDVKVYDEGSAVIVRFPFLSHSMQKVSEADPGRHYVLTINQAVAFNEALAQAILHLQLIGLQSAEERSRH